nr:hypothetical protein [Treponemataceae bacterium]
GRGETNVYPAVYDADGNRVQLADLREYKTRPLSNDEFIEAVKEFDNIKDFTLLSDIVSVKGDVIFSFKPDLNEDDGSLPTYEVWKKQANYYGEETWTLLGNNAGTLYTDYSCTENSLYKSEDWYNKLPACIKVDNVDLTYGPADVIVVAKIKNKDVSPGVKIKNKYVSTGVMRVSIQNGDYQGPNFSIQRIAGLFQNNETTKTIDRRTCIAKINIAAADIPQDKKFKKVEVTVKQADGTALDSDSFERYPVRELRDGEPRLTRFDVYAKKGTVLGKDYTIEAKITDINDKIKTAPEPVTLAPQS